MFSIQHCLSSLYRAGGNGTASTAMAVPGENMCHEIFGPLKCTGPQFKYFEMFGPLLKYLDRVRSACCSCACG